MSNEPIRIVLEVYGGDVKVVDEVAPKTRTKTAAKATSNGHKVIRKGRQPVDGKREWVCPFDGVDYASNTSLRRHFETDHGLTGTLDDIYGRICPLDGKQVPVGKRGWHEHAQKHAAANVSKVFVKAIAKGDRYGIVEATLGIRTAVAA